MTRKVDKGHSSDYDRFDRKQKKHHKPKGDSKRRLSIYDEFDEEVDGVDLPVKEEEDLEDED